MRQMNRAARYDRGRRVGTPTVLLTALFLFAPLLRPCHAAPRNPLRVADDAPVIEAPAGTAYTNPREKAEIERLIEGSDLWFPEKRVIRIIFPTDGWRLERNEFTGIPEFEHIDVAAVLDIGNPEYDVLVETTVLRDLDFFGLFASDMALKPHFAQIVGKIKKAEGVVIFGNDYKIPKIYKENGEAKGILVEIARLVDDRMAGYALNVGLFPWARAYQHALHGGGGIIGLSKTSEREAIFEYSDVIYHDKVVIVTLREKAFDYREMADLRGKTIGIGRGGSFGDEYERARASGVLNVEEDSGPVIRLKKLLRGRLDCALISPGRFALNQTIRQDPLLTRNRGRFVILPQPFKQDPNYLGFVKTMKMGGFLNAFNDALRDAKASGAVAEIIDRYDGGGGGGPPPDNIRRGPPG